MGSCAFWLRPPKARSQLRLNTYSNRSWPAGHDRAEFLPLLRDGEGHKVMMEQIAQATDTRWPKSKSGTCSSHRE
jgi:hypothetical protein